jgi:cation diffusion facilitator CzcD-associated flavoprotein CzcO
LAKVASWLGRRYLEKSIPDPVLREKLTPHYQMGCKRILLSNDYYPSLLRPNVELITDGIERIEPKGVRTTDGKLREADVMILGTGFKVAEYLSSIAVRGTDGHELNEMWRKRTQTYLGITVSGFPNMFLLMGPNTGLGHNSMIFMIEAQARYAAECIRTLRDKNLRSLDVREDAQAAFDEEVRKRTQGTVWMSGCKSWYQNDEGRNLAIWPGYTVEYWARTRKPNLDHYVLNGGPAPGRRINSAEASRRHSGFPGPDQRDHASAIPAR